jgi:hypothetical protein
VQKFKFGAINVRVWPIIEQKINFGAFFNEIFKNFNKSMRQSRKIEQIFIFSLVIDIVSCQVLS